MKSKAKTKHLDDDEEDESGRHDESVDHASATPSDGLRRSTRKRAAPKTWVSRPKKESAGYWTTIEKETLLKLLNELNTRLLTKSHYLQLYRYPFPLIKKKIKSKNIKQIKSFLSLLEHRKASAVLTKMKQQSPLESWREFADKLTMLSNDDCCRQLIRVCSVMALESTGDEDTTNAAAGEVTVTTATPTPMRQRYRRPTKTVLNVGVKTGTALPAAVTTTTAAAAAAVPVRGENAAATGQEEATDAATTAATGRAAVALAAREQTASAVSEASVATPTTAEPVTAAAVTAAAAAATGKATSTSVASAATTGATVAEPPIMETAVALAAMGRPASTSATSTRTTAEPPRSTTAAAALPVTATPSAAPSAATARATPSPATATPSPATATPSAATATATPSAATATPSPATVTAQGTAQTASTTASTTAAGIAPATAATAMTPETAGKTASMPVTAPTATTTSTASAKTSTTTSATTSPTTSLTTSATTPTTSTSTTALTAADVEAIKTATAAAVTAGPHSNTRVPFIDPTIIPPLLVPMPDGRFMAIPKTPASTMAKPPQTTALTGTSDNSTVMNGITEADMPPLKPDYASIYKYIGGIMQGDHKELGPLESMIVLDCLKMVEDHLKMRNNKSEKEFMQEQFLDIFQKFYLSIDQDILEPKKEANYFDPVTVSTLLPEKSSAVGQAGNENTAEEIEEMDTEQNGLANVEMVDQSEDALASGFEKQSNGNEQGEIENERPRNVCSERRISVEAQHERRLKLELGSLNPFNIPVQRLEIRKDK